MILLIIIFTILFILAGISPLLVTEDTLYCHAGAAVTLVCMLAIEICKTLRNPALWLGLLALFVLLAMFTLVSSAPNRPGS